MTYNSTQDMYKITNTPQNVYVKSISVDMKDKSCKSGTPDFVDFNQFSNYEVGDDFVMNSDQCNVSIPSNISNREKLYNQSNQKVIKNAGQMIKTYPNISNYTKQTNTIYNQMNSKTNEYKNVLNTIKTKKEQYNDTYNQQNNDLALLEDSNKLHVFAWGLSSLIVIAMVVVLKNRQT
jgi:subtilase family serine protease